MASRRPIIPYRSRIAASNGSSISSPTASNAANNKRRSARAVSRSAFIFAVVEYRGMMRPVCNR